MELLEQLNLPDYYYLALVLAEAKAHRFFYLKYLFNLELKPSKTLELVLVVLILSVLSLAMAFHQLYHQEVQVEVYQLYLVTQE
jgi:hypothetical protein